MNEDSHTSLIIKSSRDVSPKQAEPSSASSRYIPQDEQLSQHSTYGSFFWFYNFTKRFATRIANDMLMSFLRYWFPNTVPLPYHLVDLLRVHNNLRAERELHTVTYSRKQRNVFCSEIFMKEFFNTLSHICLSSENDVCSQHNTNDYELHTTDCEPIYVIVDSSCGSDPSSKEILVENKRSKHKVAKKYFFNNTTTIDVPSTSREFRYEALPPPNQTESVDELQMMTINLQNENEVELLDSELDNESVVISYLQHKDEILEMDGILMSTKKRASLLESVTKMETILEAVPSSFQSDIDILPKCSNND